MSSLSTVTVDKTLCKKYDFLKSFSLLYPLILVSGITIRCKIYECKRKGSNTALVQKTGELRKYAQTECSSVSMHRVT